MTTRYNIGGVSFYDPNGNMTEPDAQGAVQEIYELLRGKGWHVPGGITLNGKPVELPATAGTS